jgi:hypothetical protein
MSARPPSPPLWSRHRAAIACGAVLLTVLVHLVLMWWTSGLLWQPKMVWVQSQVPLVLETPPPRPAAPARAKPGTRGTPPPAAAPARVTAPAPATDPIPGPGENAPGAAPTPVVSDRPATEPEPASPGPGRVPEPKPAPGPLWLPGQAAQLPTAAQTLHYKVWGSVNTLTYQASSTLSFEPQPGAGYSISYKAGAFLLGNRKQVSLGHLGPTGLEPRQFTDQSRRTQITQVNAEARTVKLPGNPAEQPWDPGTQDRLSVFVQLGAWVAATPGAFDKGQAFRLPVWSSRDTETWLIVSQGTEMAQTPYGERQAIRLSRMPLGPSDARVDMWFVPQWGALPIRIEMVEADGKRVEQRLSEIEPAPPVK